MSGDRPDWLGSYKQNFFVLCGGGSTLKKLILRSQRRPGYDDLPCFLVQALEESTNWERRPDGSGIGVEVWLLSLDGID